MIKLTAADKHFVELHACPNTIHFAPIVNFVPIVVGIELASVIFGIALVEDGCGEPNGEFTGRDYMIASPLDAYVCPATCEVLMSDRNLHGTLYGCSY